MYILKHYLKPENKTDNSDFTNFGMKIGPVPDLQELPRRKTEDTMMKMISRKSRT